MKAAELYQALTGVQAVRLHHVGQVFDQGEYARQLGNVSDLHTIMIDARLCATLIFMSLRLMFSLLNTERYPPSIPGGHKP